MGAKVSRIKLPKAEDVHTAQYELKTIRSPRLSGWLLVCAVWVLESFLGLLLLRNIWHKSGITQVLREIEIPEAPTYEPLWPHPEPNSSGISVEELNPPTRAAVAAQTIPGFSAIREGSEATTRLRRWEIADYAQAYNARLVTPLEVARAILRGLRESEAAEPPMRFLAAQDSEDLLRQARDSTLRYVRGEALSCLDGVPYAVSDAIDALPYPTTAGTSYMTERRPVTKEAPSIAALRQAGALLVGKATLHELSIGMTGINPGQGTARNPYDPARVAGGSSSGSAAIVSAGLCTFALGIDGGGSVRVPAALCGVVALKPTVGRTAWTGCPNNAFSIMAFGPITASVPDALLVHAVISNAGCQGGMTPPAPTTILRNLYDDTPSLAKQPGASKSLYGKRIGVFWPWFEDADPGVVTACKAAVRTIAQLGGQVVDVQIPELELVRVAQMVSIGCEIAQACKGDYADPALRRQLNRESRITLSSTTRFLATDFLQAQKIRTRLMTHFCRIFKSADLLVSPTVSITAPSISAAAAAGGESDMTLTGELMRFTIAVNMSGIPALSLPVGHSTDGLPVGLQLMGQPWKEAELLFVASALEAAMRTRNQMPSVRYDVLYGKPS